MEIASGTTFEKPWIPSSVEIAEMLISMSLAISAILSFTPQ